MRGLQFCFVPAILLLLLCTRPALSTSIVPIPDPDLARSCRVIVAAEVIDIESRCRPDCEWISSYVTLRVLFLLKGEVDSPVLVLRQPGGRVADREVLVFGAPDFSVGQQAIFFLNTDRDGSLHVAHLNLGYYRIDNGMVQHPFVIGRNFEDESVRDTQFREALPEFVEDVRSSLTDESPGQSEVGLLETRVPIRSTPPEFSPLLDRHGVAPSFTLLGGGVRWFEPDSGVAIGFKVAGGAAPTPSHGLDEVNASLAAWNQVTQSDIELKYDGSSTTGGLRANGRNEIAFGDPLGQIDDLVNCKGVVAQTAIVIQPNETRTVNGTVFMRIIEADLVINNGIECNNDPGFLLLREIITHEVGHAIGIGHSSDNPAEPSAVLRDATMYFVAHNDGRGAGLRSDDNEAARFVYPGAQATFGLVSDALPNALPGTNYTFRIQAQGGQTPFSFTLVAGSLPSGLSLTSSGEISGVPTNLTDAIFRIHVEDANGQSAEREFHLIVTNQPSPFLNRAVFKKAQDRLLIDGWYLSSSSSVLVNGVTIAPPRQLKYKAQRGRIVVKGNAANLGIQPGDNVVEIVIDGRRSNALHF